MTSTIRRPSPEDLRSCLTHTRMIAKTSSGPVEYADRGEGEPLLSLHGSPGGADQGLVQAEYARVEGYRIIASSRPGYLGTPLRSGRSFEEQAELMVSLLDCLGVEKAAVLAVSGGGPCGYLLAALHPDRVKCLVQVDSVCEPIRLPLLSRLLATGFGMRASAWLVERAPGFAVSQILGKPSGVSRREMASRAKELLTDPVRLAHLQALTQSTCTNWSYRRRGYWNDVDLIRSLGRLPLRDVKCPTLIVHGTADTSVPPRQSEHAHAQLRGSELYWVRDGEHVGFLLDKDDRAQRRMMEWLRSTARQPERQQKA